MQLAPKGHAPVAANRVPTPGRMTLANVARGKIAKPYRIIIFGVEGVGKTMFAANAPAPIFICAEEGTAHLDVARFPTPKSWADVLEAVRVLTHEPHDFKTLAIDTFDWLEPLCWAHVCSLAGKPDIESFGFGKGYVAALEHWRLLLARLDALANARKMNIVLVGHAAIRRVDDPQTGPFDRYRMKVHERAADLLREWVDAVLFARYEVFAFEKNGKMRGRSSGARVIHTQWSAAFDAKNRFNLPEQLPLSWEEFDAAARSAAPASVEALRAELVALFPRLEEPAKAEHAMNTWAGDNPVRLAQLLDKVRAKIGLSEQAASAEAESPEPAPEAAAEPESTPEPEAPPARPAAAAPAPVAAAPMAPAPTPSPRLEPAAPPPAADASDDWSAGPRPTAASLRAELERERARIKSAKGLAWFDAEAAAAGDDVEKLNAVLFAVRAKLAPAAKPAASPSPASVIDPDNHELRDHYKASIATAPTVEEVDAVVKAAHAEREEDKLSKRDVSQIEYFAAAARERIAPTRKYRSADALCASKGPTPKRPTCEGNSPLRWPSYSNAIARSQSYAASSPRERSTPARGRASAMPADVDITGQRFGRLVALRRDERFSVDTLGYRYWLCQCDCGVLATLSRRRLRRVERKGVESSCGCFRVERMAATRAVGAKYPGLSAKARAAGLTVQALRARLQSGWSFERAVSEPLRAR
jgi:hypothetical protein